MSDELRDEVAGVLAEHAADSSDEQRVNGEWTHGLNCDCGEFVPDAEVNAHLADALLPLIREREAAVLGDIRAEGLALLPDRTAAYPWIKADNLIRAALDAGRGEA